MCPVRYRRKVFTEEVSQSLKNVCLEFGPAYEIYFLEIGIDDNHVHFLIQTVPNIRFSDIVIKVKRQGESHSERRYSGVITAKHIFKHHTEVKTFLWGGKFWTSGYYANTVGQYGNLDMITNYVKNQGIPEYEQLHAQPPTLFDLI